MNIKLVKLSYEYKQQLFDMMDEWLAAEQDFSPYMIRRNDYILSRCRRYEFISRYSEL